MISIFNFLKFKTVHPSIAVKADGQMCKFIKGPFIRTSLCRGHIITQREFRNTFVSASFAT